jgi:rSAM/selenodomain-associated transferase 2
MPPLVSVIVPVRDDSAAAGLLLAQIGVDPRLEIIVVEAEGGVGPSLSSARSDVRVLGSRPGRAIQMNAGAATATGDWLLFLHADSRLPPRWIDVFEEAVRSRRGVRENVSGGWFRFALDDPSWQARLIERGVRLRVQVLTLPYGDQGLFVRRDVFESMGGYREIPLMEDVEFVRRLVRTGPVLELPLALATSARRWQRDGWFRRSARNIVLIACYYAGVRPERLARWYARSFVG